MQISGRYPAGPGCEFKHWTVDAYVFLPIPWFAVTPEIRQFALMNPPNATSGPDQGLPFLIPSASLSCSREHPSDCSTKRVKRMSSADDSILHAPLHLFTDRLNRKY